MHLLWNNETDLGYLDRTQSYLSQDKGQTIRNPIIPRLVENKPGNHDPKRVSSHLTCNLLASAHI